MTKTEFLFILKEKLKTLGEAEAAERINFYSELIDDKIEDGATEEAAIAEIGNPEEIAEQIKAELNTPRNNEGKTSRKHSAFQITMLAIGSPIWASLLISAAAVALSLYVSLAAVVISFWAADLALALSFPVGIVGFILLLFRGSAGMAFIVFGAGAIAGGLSAFAFFGMKKLTALCIKLTKSLCKELKRCFTKNKEAEK